MATRRIQGSWVVFASFAVAWLVLIFFSSLHLNREANRESFFESFSVLRFLLVGLMPVICIGGGFFIFALKKSSVVSPPDKKQEDLHGSKKAGNHTVSSDAETG